MAQLMFYALTHHKIIDVTEITDAKHLHLMLSRNNVTFFRARIGNDSEHVFEIYISKSLIF